MNRRSFLWNTGIVGAGLLGAGNAAPGLLRADTAGGKTRGFYRTPAAVLV